MIKHTRKQDPAAEAEFRRIVLQTMVLMIAADRVIDTDELKVVSRIYGDLVGERISGDTVLKAVVKAQEDGVGLIETLSQNSGSLTVDDRDFLIQAAFAVCAADEYVSSAERKDLADMAKVLGVPRGSFNALYAQLDEADW